MTEILCKRCGYLWIARTEHPAVCPRCKSYNYDTDPRDYKKKKEDK